MGKNKSIKCANCNRTMRSNNILRHQASKICGKYTAGTSQCPFVYCRHHTTLPNLRRHIKKYHPEVGARSIKQLYEIATRRQLAQDAIAGDQEAKLELKAKYVSEVMTNMLIRRLDVFQRCKKGFKKFCKEELIKSQLQSQEEWKKMTNQKKIEWVYGLIRQNLIYKSSSDQSAPTPLAILLGALNNNDLQAIL